MPYEVSKTLKNIENLYPDLVTAGNLYNALQNELAKIGSILPVTGLEESPEDFIVYAKVENDQRSSQIYIAAERRT